MGPLQGHWRMSCFQGKVSTIPLTNLDSACRGRASVVHVNSQFHLWSAQ